MPTPQRVINLYKMSSHQLDPKNSMHLLDRYDITDDERKNSGKGSKPSFDKILDQKLKKK